VPENESKPGEAEAEAAGHPVQRAASTAWRVYRAVDKLDHWSGGGQTLALVVKIFGWVGLLCVLGALVVKLNDVARRLDPVTNGIAHLAARLEESKAQLTHENEQRRESAKRLEDATRNLEAGLTRLHEAQATQAATDVAQGFRSALERLRSEDEQSAQSAARLLDALDQSQRALGQVREALARQSSEFGKASADALTAAAGAADAGRALASSEEQAREQLGQTQHTLAQLDTAKLQASLARANAAADELARALEQAKAPATKASGVGAVAKEPGVKAPAGAGAAPP